MSRTKRIRITVRWSKTQSCWFVDERAAHRGLTITDTSYQRTKLDAVAAGRKMGRKAYIRGRLAQLVVFKKDGKIETEHTYGRDPRRSPG